MLEINDKTNYINVFNNITELIKYLGSRNTKSGRKKESQQEGDEDDFFGTESFEEAIDLLKYGDNDLYNQIKKEQAKININKMIGAYNQKLKYKNKTYGCVPNVPAYLRNNPINMINPEKKQPANRILNIFLNIRVRGFTDKEEIIKIGLKYLTILDILEKSGYRCNLYSGCANETNNKYSYFMVRIKTDKEPLNLKKICFTIANPSMQRRIKFRWMEVNDFEQDYTHNGYGGHDDSKHTQKVLNEKLKDNYIVWTYENDSISKTEEEILKDLEENYGIKIERN